jgi:hypothetical protein
MAGFSNKFKGANFGLGISTAIDKLGDQIDAKLAAKLKTQLPAAYRESAKAAEELAAAEKRLTEVRKLDDATLDAHGTRSMQYFKQVRQAQKEVEEATTKSSAAQHEYTTKLDAFNVASQKTFSMTNMMAGALGGLAVGGIEAVISGFEHLAELGAHIFEDAAEGAITLGEKLLEAGDGFEQISAQVVEYSGESGAALQELQERAEKVFGTLDVAGKNVGQTMAVFASRLHMEPGQALDDLSRKVTDLQGRFSDLKTDAVAKVFVDFGVDSEHASEALDTLVSNAQNAGVSLGKLSSDLAGPVAETFKEAGLNFGQAAHVMADLEQQGISTSDVIRGIPKAMGEYKKEGVSFKDGLAETRRELEQLGDTARSNALADKLFGTKWIDAVKIIQAMNDALAQSPDAFDGAAGAAQNMIDKTATLENKIEALKNKAALMFKPFEEAAVGAVSHGLDLVSKWFDTHHHEIIGKIKEWGDKLIDLLPVIKDWAVTALDIFGFLANGIAIVMSPITEMLAVAGAGMLAITGHFQDAKDLLGAATQFNIDAFTSKIGATITSFANTIDALNIPTEKWKNDLNDTADAVDRLADSMTNLPGVSPDNGQAWPVPFGGAAPGAASAGGEPIWGGPSAPNLSNLPGPYGAPGPQGMPGASSPLAPQDMPSSFNWDAVAQAESSGNWSNADTGHNGHYGGLQFAPATWAAYGGTMFADRADHASREQQIEVANRVAFTGWNGTPPQGLGAWETITNGTVPMPAGGRHVSLADYTTPGGMPGGAGDFGASAGHPTGPPPDENSIRGWVQNQFGIPNTFGTGSYENRAHEDDHKWHHPLPSMTDWKGPTLSSGGEQFGYAFDFHGTQEQMAALANWVATNWRQDTLELIYQGPGFDHNREISNAKFGDVFGSALNAAHTDHVHWATTVNPAGMPTGASPMGYGTPGGARGYRQGYGPGTPEWDRENRRRSGALRDANDNLADLNERLNGPDGVNAKLTQAQNSLREEQNKFPQEQDQHKIEELQKDIARLTRERDRIQNREIPDANDRLAEAQDAMNEPMPGAESGRHGRGSEYGFAKSFGEEFLSGIFEAIGLPNLSQFLPDMKSPLEFGSVKLGMGVLNWGLGMLGRMGHGGPAPGMGPTHVSQPDPNQPGYNGPIIPGMASGNGFGANTAMGGGKPGWWGSSPGPGNQPGVHVAGDVHGDTYNIHPASDRELVHAVQTHAASWEKNANQMNASSGIAHL